MEKENIIGKVYKKYRKFLIAPLSVTIILLIIYAIKGIFPFGRMTIANGDMGQSYMTFYHFLYDIFYNGKNIFYDYTLGMGSNMYGGFMIDGLLNPSAFLILLGSRESIPYMFSIILTVKIAFIALTSFILFNKLYKENTFYNVIFSIIYALSGYVLMYNTNIMWLDVVGLFPLFILAIKYMFETDKIHWYAIVLALMLIFNYNLAYMVLMFIIFVIPIYIKFGLPKEKRKKAIFNVIIGTILSVGLSAFAFIPSFMQVMTSYRMSGVTTNTVQNINILFKIVVFIFYAIPIYGYVQWFKYRKEDKNNILMFSIALIFTAIIPIIFERVNLLWHTGSYQLFPYRYGFIPTLILYLGALRYFNNYEKTEKRKIKTWKAFRKITVIVFIFAIVIGIVNVININKSMPAFFVKIDNFAGILVTFILMLLVIKSIYNIDKENIKKTLLVIVVITETLMYTYAYVGVDREFRNGVEWSDEGIFTSYEIADMNIPKTLYKIKDLTASTTENCSLVYNIPSMSTFLHLINTEQVMNCEQLGYSHNNTKINDFGGTIMSDAVYGVKYVLSKQDLSDKIYEYISTSKSGIKLYQYKNSLPIGITYDNEVIDIPEELGAFDAQNYLYRYLFNKQDNIIEKKEDNFIDAEKKGNKIKVSFMVEDSSVLYLYSKYYDLINEMTVNGEKVTIPILNDKENTRYITQYNNGLLDLGVFENQIVEIEFDTDIDNMLSFVEIGILNIDKYNDIFNMDIQDINVEIKGNKIKINGNIDKDTNLLIPINYDKGWKISNSNQNIEIKRVYNNFIGLELKQGENNIELEFTPYLFKESVIITISTILGMIIMSLIKRKFDIRNIGWIMNVFWILGIIIYVGCIFKIYIMSIINTFIG